MWSLLEECSSVCLCFCSTGPWQVAEEHMGHSGGDVRRRAFRLLCRLHRRAHQGLPVWRVFTSRQGERSALPRSANRCVIRPLHNNINTHTFPVVVLNHCIAFLGLHVSSNMLADKYSQTTMREIEHGMNRQYNADDCSPLPHWNIANPMSRPGVNNIPLFVSPFYTVSLLGYYRVSLAHSFMHNSFYCVQFSEYQPSLPPALTFLLKIGPVMVNKSIKCMTDLKLNLV